MRLSIAVLSCLFLSNATILADTSSVAPIDVDWSAIRDIDGQAIDISGAHWTVVCFLGAECPLARLYGPRLQSLAEEFAGDGIKVVGINSNLQDSPADIKAYLKQLDLGFAIIKDGQQLLARQFRATRTPEVFVLDRKGQVRYRGRIDDQYQPGTARAKPTRQELRSALQSLVEGKSVEVAKTEAVGCLITFRRAPLETVDVDKAVTFTRDVAPVLNKHCVECHRPGEIGPFALTDYDEVTGWGEMILEVIRDKRMPPWHAEPGYAEIVDARRMPANDQQVIADWVAQGMPQGDPKHLPVARKWAKGWHLSTPPNVEFDMRERPFVVPTEGTVDYQYFVVDPDWKEDRWIHAAQVVPGDASVVHHAIVFIRPPDGTRFEGIGWIGGYVPGQRTRPLPTGHARRVQAGSKLVFQMHYTPNGRKTKDTTRVGIWFADQSAVTHEVSTRVVLNNDFEIPPGAKNHIVNMNMQGFARESRLLSLTPHMHLRGKSFRLDVERANGTETLLSVPHYDFNWQHWYQLKTPIRLDDIHSIQMKVGFDNSANNPHNPNPDEFVTWGDQTWQEMSVAFFDIAYPRNKPRVYVNQRKQPSPQQVATRQQQIDKVVDQFFKSLDQDGDGVILKDETPDAFRRYGFWRIDRNGNKQLERDEVARAAAQRIRIK